MMNERRWSGAAYQSSRAQGDQIESLMRSILKLFADGCLVYRSREQLGPSVKSKSDRLRRLRRAAVTVSANPRYEGPAAVA